MSTFCHSSVSLLFFFLVVSNVYHCYLQDSWNDTIYSIITESRLPFILIFINYDMIAIVSSALREDVHSLIKLNLTNVGTQRQLP